MKRSSRLSRSDDINRVRQLGQFFVHDTIVLGTLPNQFDKNRIAIVAGRSVGGAVQRNLAKRRMRSAYQTLQAALNQGFDLVFIARRRILSADYSVLLIEMEAVLEQAGLMKEIES